MHMRYRSVARNRKKKHRRTRSVAFRTCTSICISVGLKSIFLVFFLYCCRWWCYYCLLLLLLRCCPLLPSSSLQLCYVFAVVVDDILTFLKIYFRSVFIFSLVFSFFKSTTRIANTLAKCMRRTFQYPVQELKSHSPRHFIYFSAI